MSPRKASDLTFTDQFCGAGGSSIGAVRAGLRGRMALNHWALAIETHNTNFPDIDHDCTDISACDPRRYPSTDILITSPECTTHSPAGGSRRSTPQRDLFRRLEADPAVIRSRATMFDVVRFSEYHQYRIVIVENVFEATRWDLFPEWLRLMEKLGYRHRIVSLNSMFAHPTPQSRDRIYIVFWRAKNRAPDLNIMPAAWCPRCEKNVEAVQTWKNARTVGKYRQQYVFTCSLCRVAVAPYYFAALNAIDFSIPAERIGDRPRPLKPRTMDRIRFGLEKYGRQSLVIRTNMTSGVECRVRSASGEPFDTQPATAITGLVSPFILNGHMARRVYGVDEPMATQAASREHDSVVMPFVMSAGSNAVDPRGVAETCPAITCSDRLGLVSPFIIETAFSQVGGGAGPRGMDAPLATQGGRRSAALVTPFLVTLRGTSDGQRGAWASPLDDPTKTVSAGGVHHGVVQGAALMTMRDSRGMGFLFRGLDDAMGTQVGSCTQDWLLQRAPFLISYYGTKNVSGGADAVPTLTGLDRHGMVQPAAELQAEDCYFRMLQPNEIGAAMAFPGSYTVLGNKRDQVKQYGNAVTPPAMALLIERCVQSLTGERAA